MFKKTKFIIAPNFSTYSKNRNREAILYSLLILFWGILLLPPVSTAQSNENYPRFIYRPKSPLSQPIRFADIKDYLLSDKGYQFQMLVREGDDIASGELIARVSVRIKLIYPLPENLVIELIPPVDQPISIHNLGTGTPGSNGIDTVFTSKEAYGLNILRGIPPIGSWTLVFKLKSGSEVTGELVDFAVIIELIEKQKIEINNKNTRYLDNYEHLLNVTVDSYGSIGDKSIWGSELIAQYQPCSKDEYFRFNTVNFSSLFLYKENRNHLLSSLDIENANSQPSIRISHETNGVVKWRAKDIYTSEFTLDEKTNPLKCNLIQWATWCEIDNQKSILLIQEYNFHVENIPNEDIVITRYLFPIMPPINPIEAMTEDFAGVTAFRRADPAKENYPPELYVFDRFPFSTEQGTPFIGIGYQPIQNDLYGFDFEHEFFIMNDLFIKKIINDGLFVKSIVDNKDWYDYDNDWVTDPQWSTAMTYHPVMALSTKLKFSEHTNKARYVALTRWGYNSPGVIVSATQPMWTDPWVDPEEPTPEPTPTETPVPPTPTPTFTPTITPTPSNTPTPTRTYTPTRTPTFTPTITPTFTPTFTPTNTPIPSPTPSPTVTPMYTLPPVPTSTPTTPLTPTMTPTFTPVYSPTPPPSPTPAVTPTFTPTATFTPTFTPTETPSPSSTPTVTATFTPTPSPTFTPSPTYTPAFTPTATYTPTWTPTDTPVPTPTQTPTATYTYTPAITPSPTASYTPTPRPSVIPPTPTFTFTPTATPTPILTVLCTNNISIQQFSSIAIGSRPVDLLVEDLTQDGYPDVLTSAPAQGDVLLFESTGEPNQPLRKTLIPAGVEIEFLAAGDVNGDGYPDIGALSYLDEKLVILLGGGTKPFSRRVEIEIPYFDISPLRTLGRVQPMVCRDLDQNRSDEIYVIQLEGGWFNSLVQISLDSTTLAPSFQRFAIDGLAPQDLQAIDFMDTGNGQTDDLLLFTTLNPTVTVCAREEGARYRVREDFPLEDTIQGNNMTGFRKRDADGDGLADLFVVPFDGSLRLLSANGSRFHQSKIARLTERAIHDDVLVSDLDRDGKNDLMIVSRQSSGGSSYEQISVLCGDNPGEFTEAATFVTDRLSSPFSSLRLGTLDLNRDGWLDIVFLDDFSKELVLLLNTSQTRVPQWLWH